MLNTSRHRLLIVNNLYAIYYFNKCRSSLRVYLFPRATDIQESLGRNDRRKIFVRASPRFYREYEKSCVHVRAKM